MAKGNAIIVTADPCGVFKEGVIDATPNPGFIMELKPAVAPVSGRHTWRARSTTAGSKGGIWVLLGDKDQGKLSVGAIASFGMPAVGDAYVSGTRGFLYAPLMGDELNLVVKDVAGTADDVAIGDLFGVNATGSITANAAYTSAPFQAMEVVTDPTANYLMWVLYLGNNA